MKKVVATMAVALVLVTAGCAGGSGEKIAKDECVSLLEDRTRGEKIDVSGLKASSMTDALYESGITDERDSEKIVYSVLGDVTSKVATTERRISVMCQVTVTSGEVTSSSIETY